MLLCGGFFDCASVLTKSVVEIMFAYIWNVAFVALCHINEIRRTAIDVMSSTLLHGQECVTGKYNTRKIPVLRNLNYIQDSSDAFSISYN